MIGYLIIAALASAPAGEAPPLENRGAQEYRSCVREESEGKLGSRTVRYSDEVFLAALRACAAAASPHEDPVAEGVWYTRVYIETLAVQNSLRPLAAERAAPALIVTAPSANPSTADDRLDPFTRDDFSVLYWPWVRCLAAAMQAGGATEPGQTIGVARTRCNPVASLADGEATRLLDANGRYGDAQRREALLTDFKDTAAQLALLGFLRSNGESAGVALERSEEARTAGAE